MTEKRYAHIRFPGLCINPENVAWCTLLQSMVKVHTVLSRCPLIRVAKALLFAQPCAGGPQISACTVGAMQSLVLARRDNNEVDKVWLLPLMPIIAHSKKLVFHQVVRVSSSQLSQIQNPKNDWGKKKKTINAFLINQMQDGRQSVATTLTLRGICSGKTPRKHGFAASKDGKRPCFTGVDCFRADAHKINSSCSSHSMCAPCTCLHTDKSSSCDIHDSVRGNGPPTGPECRLLLHPDVKGQMCMTRNASVIDLFGSHSSVIVLCPFDKRARLLIRIRLCFLSTSNHLFHSAIESARISSHVFPFLFGLKAPKWPTRKAATPCCHQVSLQYKKNMNFIQETGDKVREFPGSQSVPCGVWLGGYGTPLFAQWHVGILQGRVGCSIPGIAATPGKQNAALASGMEHAFNFTFPVCSPMHSLLTFFTTSTLCSVGAPKVKCCRLVLSLMQPALSCFTTKISCLLCARKVKHCCLGHPKNCELSKVFVGLCGEPIAAHFRVCASKQMVMLLDACLMKITYPTRHNNNNLCKNCDLKPNHRGSSQCEAKTAKSSTCADEMLGYRRDAMLGIFITNPVPVTSVRTRNPSGLRHVDKSTGSSDCRILMPDTWLCSPTFLHAGPLTPGITATPGHQNAVHTEFEPPDPQIALSSHLPELLELAFLTANPFCISGTTMSNCLSCFARGSHLSSHEHLTMSWNGILLRILQGYIRNAPESCPVLQLLLFCRNHEILRTDASRCILHSLLRMNWRPRISMFFYDQLGDRQIDLTGLACCHEYLADQEMANVTFALLLCSLYLMTTSLCAFPAILRVGCGCWLLLLTLRYGKATKIGNVHPSKAKWIGHRRFACKKRKKRTVGKRPCFSWTCLAQICIACICCLIIVMWLTTSRIGEADNPGPKELSIVTCNPTTIWNKQDLIWKLCPAVVGISETAATQPVQNQLTKWCREKGLHVQWSAPVGTLGQSAAGFRGLAGGTAIVSAFPQRTSLTFLPDDIYQSNRFCETHVLIAPHRYMYVASIYGPTDAFKYADHSALMNRIFDHAAERASFFQGPAAIVGDFNTSLDKVNAWNSLRKVGWVDAAKLAAQINGHELDNTSCDAVRHSFILVNSQLARTLKTCRTCHQHMFSTHPVLQATFDTDTLCAPVQRWTLPRSFDLFQADPELANNAARNILLKSQRSWERILSQGDVDEMARKWTIAAEQTLAASAVDTEGRQCVISNAFLGRSSRSPLKKNSKVIPLNKKARDGDLQSCQDQGSTQMRRQLKQLHRLQSAVRQAQSLTRNYHAKAHAQLMHLWKTSFYSKAFKKGFGQWVWTNLQMHVNENLPCLEALIEALIEIKDAYSKWYQYNEQIAKSAKQAFQKIELIEDWRKGGKVAFSKVKTNDLSPLTAIKNQVQCPIRRVAWSKEGRTFLPSSCSWKLDPNLPVVFQTQKARIKSLSEKGVHLDRRVHLINYFPDQLVITQEQSFVNPEDMHNQLFCAWNIFFQRDPCHELHNVPDEMCMLVDKIPQSHLAKMPPITGDVINQALKNTKLASSRGSDGFSTLDLRKLPMSMLDMLAFILQLVEQNGQWPKRWTLAKTLCLPKCAEPSSPYDVRPVTVMSKIYRLWGHIRGKQVTAFISANIPPEIAGVCRRVSSDLVALLIASKIEDAHRESKPLCGIVIDLMKCYNTVPRGALLRTLQRLGVPHHILNAFQAMMRQMTRFFEVAQCCSDPQLTTTGIIEGCGFAIPSMLAISIIAYVAVTEASPDAQCAFFADNWSVCASSLDSLQSSLAALHDVTHKLRMKIAPKKSWSWATTTTLRRQCETLQIESCRIPLVHSAHDLGMQQNYTKKQAKKTIKAKVRKAKEKLQVIKKSKIPRGMKARIAASSGQACVMYAGSFQQLAPQDYHTLRANTAKSMQCAGSGANSYLACNACDPCLDPEFKLLFLRFQMWKRFQKIFPQHAESLHQKCKDVQDCPAKLKMPGPVSALVSAAIQIGCRFGDRPGDLCVANRTCQWMLVSTKTLKNLLQNAWVNHVATKRIQRKHFDVHLFDWIGNGKCCADLSHHHRCLMSIYQTGRHITNDALSKFLPGVENKCVLCGKPDSREHRAFHCVKLCDIRPKQCVMQRIRRTWKEASWHFGLVPHIPDASAVLESVTCHCVPFQLPSSNDDDRFVFTDGSAFFNDIPNLSIAAAACVEVDPNTCICLGVQADVVPGCEQHSFAGELFAILLALNRFYHVHLYSDCETAVCLIENELRNCQINHDLQGCLHLWEPIKRHLCGSRDRRITITKVKAHVLLRDNMNQREQWLAWGNSLADRTAKEVITIRHKAVYTALEKMRCTVVQQRSGASEFFRFVATASERCINASTAMQKNRQRLVTFDKCQPGLVEPQHGITTSIEFSVRQFLAFPWGPVFLWCIVFWARQLVWPSIQFPSLPDISLLELYVDFMCTTGSKVPKNIFTKAQRDKYTAPNFILEDLELRADAAATTLGAQMQTWSKCIAWLVTFAPGLFPTCLTHKSHSITLIGSSATMRGMNARPRMVHGPVVLDLLNNYFCTSTGYNRTLNRIFETPPVEIPAHPQELNVPFCNRAKDIRNAAKIFQT